MTGTLQKIAAHYEVIMSVFLPSDDLFSSPFTNFKLTD